MTNVNDLNLEELNLEQLEEVDGGFGIAALASSDKLLILSDKLLHPLAVSSRSQAVDVVAPINSGTMTESELELLYFKPEDNIRSSGSLLERPSL